MRTSGELSLRTGWRFGIVRALVCIPFLARVLGGQRVVDMVNWALPHFRTRVGCGTWERLPDDFRVTWDVDSQTMSPLGQK